MNGGRAFPAAQFETLEQQHDTARLGLWCFLATEVLFFGGLFTSYTVYRYLYPHAFAVGSNHNNLLLGTLNTAVLLTSSLAMALAVRAAQLGKAKAQLGWLLLTIAFAFGFLVIKGLEYSQHIHEHLLPGPGFDHSLGRQTELFLLYYWLMTGLHALHVIIGIGILSVIAWLSWREPFTGEYYSPMEMSGLYWHFVDIVWVFLYPLLYLINRHIS
ncbi:MAG: cytochrome c oxidase subunit [Verrucomicrobiales bacterium]|nr:cytochrome c oxidase subunit [Verrucomicrobiales bacterium]